MQGAEGEVVDAVLPSPAPEEAQVAQVADAPALPAAGGVGLHGERGPAHVPGTVARAGADEEQGRGAAVDGGEVVTPDGQVRRERVDDADVGAVLQPQAARAAQGLAAPADRHRPHRRAFRRARLVGSAAHGRPDGVPCGGRRLVPLAVRGVVTVVDAPAVHASSTVLHCVLSSVGAGATVAIPIVAPGQPRGVRHGVPSPLPVSPGVSTVG